MQRFENTNVHKQEEHAIENIFNRNGAHADSKILFVVVVHHFFFNACAGEDAVDNEKRNEDKEKRQIEFAEVVGFYFRFQVDQEE